MIGAFSVVNVLNAASLDSKDLQNLDFKNTRHSELSLSRHTELERSEGEVSNLATLDSIKLAENTESANDKKDASPFSKAQHDGTTDSNKDASPVAQHDGETAGVLSNDDNTESNLQDSKAITESNTQDSNKATKTYNLEKVTTIMSNARSQREIFEMNDNIASVSGESLEKLNIQNTQDLQKVFSGLYITNDADVSSPQITLRGMHSSFSKIPSVRIYVDDVPQDSMFMNQEMLDVYSVELFKGMAGTLYGENAQAGILSINSNIASNKTRVSASFTLGTLDRILSASASGALIKDRLFAKVSVKSLDFLGQVKDESTGFVSDTTNSKLARISLLYDNGVWFLGADYYLDKGMYNNFVFLYEDEIKNK